MQFRRQSGQDRPGEPSRGLGGPWLDERRLAPVETIQPRRRDGGLLAERRQDPPLRPHRRQTVETRDLRRAERGARIQSHDQQVGFGDQPLPLAHLVEPDQREGGPVVPIPVGAVEQQHAHVLERRRVADADDDHVVLGLVADGEDVDLADGLPDAAEIGHVRRQYAIRRPMAYLAVRPHALPSDPSPTLGYPPPSGPRSRV